MTTYLCECIGVSKSGYYNYLKNENKRIERDNKDQKDFDLILRAYKFKKRKKGARQIMMVLDNEFNVHFNLKKIRRLMKYILMGKYMMRILKYLIYLKVQIKN